jgi:hypothetical protein
MKNPIALTVITLSLAASSLLAATHYVSLGSTNPTPPYTNWVTAATNIQDAVDAAAAGDVVVVTDGTYATGSRWVYRVVVDKPLTLQSVNGPEVTVIDGGSVVGCVFLANGANLFGFTLTRGVAYSGGGVTCPSTSAVLSNCVLTGNSASGYDGMGGGALGGTLNNCTLTGNTSAFDGGGVSGGVSGGAAILNNCTLAGNSAAYFGGGAQAATLNNCTLIGNSASEGGGAFFGTLNNCTLAGNSAQVGSGAVGAALNNCTLARNSDGGDVYSPLYNSVVYFNTASGGANYDSTSTLNYCCTTPLPTNGVGNITNDPLFVNYASGNLRLQSNSPCINAGNNLWLPNHDAKTGIWFTNVVDLDGNPRIVSGTLDMGAYEYQGTGSVISYAWLQQYGLPKDGSADYADPDHDGLNNWQEWVCGTNPTNALSALRVVSALLTGTTMTVTWQSVVGVDYFLQRSTNLVSPFMLLATNVVGLAGTTSCADTNATGAGPFFYRVGVQSW